MLLLVVCADRYHIFAIVLLRESGSKPESEDDNDVKHGDVLYFISIVSGVSVWKRSLNCSRKPSFNVFIPDFIGFLHLFCPLSIFFHILIDNCSLDALVHIHLDWAFKITAQITIWKCYRVTKMVSKWQNLLLISGFYLPICPVSDVAVEWDVFGSQAKPVCLIKPGCTRERFQLVTMKLTIFIANSYF